MRKLFLALMVLVLAGVGLAGTASAQDAQLGTVTADPQTVPAPGEYTFAATGAGFIPDTDILVLKCTAPGDALVPGASVEEITATALMIDPLADCDVGAAQNVAVDSDGNWTASLTAEVGDNFFLSAGDLAGTQAGVTWVPIIPEPEAISEEPAADEELPNTGVETTLMGVIGVAVLGAGVLVAREARRLS